jgi:carbon storage regulator CsrA
MLILSRKFEQVIHLHTLDGLVKIKVTDVDRQTGKVRLGIDAPDSVDIIRAEIDMFDPNPA